MAPSRSRQRLSFDVVEMPDSALSPIGAPVPPPPNTHPNLSARLETFARAGAVLFGAAYVAGFVIVTLHHARFGVLQFDLLRPRVLAAGVVFLVFVSVPVYVAFYFFNVSWLRHASKAYSDKPEHQPLLNVCAGCLVCDSCWLIVWFSPFQSIAAADILTSVPLTSLAVGLVGLSLTVTLITQRQFQRAPRLCTLSMCLTTVGIYVVAAIFFPAVWVLAFWFSAVGLVAVFAYYVSRDREFLRGFRWDVEVMLIGTVLTLGYARFIYGGIGVAYGGGLPAPVTVHFTNDNPITQSKRLQAQMIDETDKGYYLLIKRDDGESAVFFSREQVCGIDFNPKQKSSALPQKLPEKSSTPASNPSATVPTTPEAVRPAPTLPKQALPRR
jgi:hypothetical protein